MKHKHTVVAIVILLLSVFIGLSVTCTVRESLTFDEIVHIQEGKNALLRQEFKIDTNNPPLIREMAVVPLVLGLDRFVPSSPPNIQALPARMVIIALGVLLGLFIFITARNYFGVDAGLFALFLFVFNPDILAHSHYVTQDIGVTLFFFLSYVVFIRTLEKPGRRNFAALGILTGFMAASKVTALPYFALSVVFVSLYMYKKRLVLWIWRYKFLMLLSLGISLMIIWTTYFYHSSVIIAPGGSEGRLSDRLMGQAVQNGNEFIQSALRFFKTQPVPLGDYIAVLKNSVVRSTQPAQIFFFGKFYPRSEWYFMGVNAFLKFPLPIIVLFFMGFWFGLAYKKSNRKIIIFSIPVFSIFLIASVTGMQPLVRYILPIVPFVILVSASFLHLNKTRYQKVFTGLLCLWYAAGTLLSFPNFLSYTNELIGRKDKYLKFIDSNIDWGQSLPDFQKYVDFDQPSTVYFSYFGRDDAAKYGLKSNTPFGSYIFDEICEFHIINYPKNTGPPLTAISVSNWYYCGYSLNPVFSKEKLNIIIGDSILVF